MTRARRLIAGAFAGLLLAAASAPSATALVRGNQVYIGIYNFAGQDTILLIVFQTRLPDGRVIWDRARHVLAHRVRKLIGVRVTKGRLASCRGGIFTRRQGSEGRTWDTRHEVDLCKLYRVRLDSGRAGPTKVKLDYSRTRDPAIYKDPWNR